MYKLWKLRNFDLLSETTLFGKKKQKEEKSQTLTEHEPSITNKNSDKQTNAKPLQI